MSNGSGLTMQYIHNEYKGCSWPNVVAGDFRMSKRDLEDAASCQHHLIYTGPERYLE